MEKKATFGAGCFWGIEEAFRTLPGVLSTRVGYTGGSTDNPAYPEVCTGKTGHAEAVQVTFDPEKISYNDLLKTFWKIHDPTTLNRQGVDIGTQYRSAIFFHDEKQKQAATLSKEEMKKSENFASTIVTEIIEATKFFEAEEYHQKYVLKKGLSSCSI